MRATDHMKRGIVVDGKGAQVRVLFDDHDKTVSPWLDVGHQVARGARIYHRPKRGSQVVCLMDRHWEAGVVVGSIYSDEDPAPADSDTLLHVEFGDGTALTYEETTGLFHLNHASGLELSIEGGSLSVKGDVMIDGDLTVSGATALADTTINGVTQTGS